MKRRLLVTLLVLLIVLCAIAIFYFSSKYLSKIEETEPPIAALTPAAAAEPTPSTSISTFVQSSPPVPADAATSQEIQDRKWDAVFSNAVNFYGKVVDEKDNPIEGARVRYSVPSDLSQIGKGTVEGSATDVNGLFSITGKIGAGITVIVSHPSYYSTNQSSKQIPYFKDTDSKPTANSPVVFVLRKKGTPEPLLKLKQVLRTVPKDGRSVQVGLSGERASELSVQAWTSPRPQGSANNAPFAWKIRIEVPGGGLATNEDQFQFQAPENGYVPMVEFEMPEDGIDGKWIDRFQQNYFVKLPNGNYARMRFQMIAGGNNFAVVESYYNPSGSRNLEFDPQVTPEE